MDLAETISVSLKVLSDWRVASIALAVILAWAALRYVGSVYHRRSRARPRPSPIITSAPPAGRGAAKARKSRAAARASEAQGSEEDSDSGMVE
jgi:peptidoglycan/LPS O-acetylase OafA/YrhL